MYNNTIIHYPTYSGGHGINCQSSSDDIGLDIRNNIVVNDAGHAIYLNRSTYSSVNVNNNIYYTTGTGLTGKLGASTYTTLALWQTAISGTAWTGKDTASLNTNPIFTSSSDFSLQSTSSAIDVGVSLGSDYDDAIYPGSTWPSSVTTADQDLRGSGWEIGAYVYPVPQVSTISTSHLINYSLVRWNFTDNANDETGFRLYDNTNTVVASSATANLSYLDEEYVCNGNYSGRYVKTYNTYGESVASGVATTQPSNVCRASSGGGGGGGSYSPAPISTPAPTPVETIVPTETITTPEETTTPAPTPVLMPEQQRSELITEIKQQLIELLTQLIQMLLLQVQQKNG